MKVLITGAKGFIGSNLLKHLNNIEHVEIIEFNRNNTVLELEQQIQDVDFIYHLAGEVKPKSSNEEFEESNVLLTKNIINVIERSEKKIPILMVSSIHAELQKNAYGRTKRAAENALKVYGTQNDVAIWIYRLPHVFGEDCKPNYNSVVSTWMYNSIIDKEIVVYDRNIQMTYVYVQDFVDQAVLHLHENIEQGFCAVSNKYFTTLGEVIDYIEEFHKNLNNEFYTPDSNEFKRKLYKTYYHYYRKYVL